MVTRRLFSSVAYHSFPSIELIFFFKRYLKYFFFFHFLFFFLSSFFYMYMCICIYIYI
ncbi:hypothetical protein BJ944DRAFT_274161 [Cunninghamella echinulata]|nr:hypothetical protein BJ944DRAFT_274161 [Cunninghamella echinulata]